MTPIQATTTFLLATQIIWLIQSDCNSTTLGIITQSAMTKPTESVFGTIMYGENTGSALYSNQGRINAINDWGVYRRSTTYNNSLYIAQWDADDKNITDDGELGSTSYRSHACTPFTLPCGEYIIGYRTYDSTEYITGLSFYTSFGCMYDCIGYFGANLAYTKNVPVTDHGVISYYYSDTDFWYLTGFSGRSGMIIDSLGFQFTQFVPPITCQPTQSPTQKPTMVPSTAYPTEKPTMAPTLSPSLNPTLIPTHDRAPTKTVKDNTQSVGSIFGSMDDTTLIIVGSIGFCVCLCLICGCIVIYLTCKRVRGALRKDTEAVECVDIIHTTYDTPNIETMPEIQTQMQPGAYRTQTRSVHEGMVGGTDGTPTNDTIPGLNRCSTSQLFIPGTRK
eukprot:27862_1